MLPVNKNITKGQANGLQVILEKVVLKPNVQPETVMINGNVPVQVVQASQVDHSNDKVEPQVFSIKPRSYTFDAKVPKQKSLQTRDRNHETLRMKAMQLLVIVNDAMIRAQAARQQYLQPVYTLLEKCKKLGLCNAVPCENKKWLVSQGSNQQNGLRLLCKQRMMDKFHQKTPNYWSNEQYSEMFEFDGENDE
jgi:hypothetical protein